ncbi:DNA repair protein [Planoprotostelium fungivorum]|uniref:DNA repair protein n=1 Tax=Planoprotostelium fungivorum TaxID=1890364 RepID=A0A2P6NT72_9EUKA|nr:DNA repair protein [Planoprotostelium fungivorum]
MTQFVSVHGKFSRRCDQGQEGDVMMEGKKPKTRKWITVNGQPFWSFPLSSYQRIFGSNWATSGRLEERSIILQKSTKEDSNEEEAVKSSFPTLERSGGVSFCIDLEHASVEEKNIPRRFMNQKRWDCIVRPQYKYACGIASLVGCWNYLYSTNGTGELPPLNQEEAMQILGFYPPYADIRFGPFTGNMTLIKWFNTLNSHFKVDGGADYWWGPPNRHKFWSKTGEQMRDQFAMGLQTDDMSFIYHCWNHYIVPVGFEFTHKGHEEAGRLTSSDEDEMWVYLADSSGTNPPITLTKFEHIHMDILCQKPFLLNIRHLERGILFKKKNGDLEEEDVEPTEIETNHVDPQMAEFHEDGTGKSAPPMKGYRNHCILVFPECQLNANSVDVLLILSEGGSSRMSIVQQRQFTTFYEQLA